MKRTLYRIFTFMLYLLLSATKASADETMTFIQSSGTAGVLEGAPEGTSAVFTNDYSYNRFMLTAGHTMTLTIKGMPRSATLKSISLLLKTNASSGLGKVEAWIGENKVTHFNIPTLGNDYRNIKIGATPTPFTSDLVVRLSASANSVYCCRFQIQYLLQEHTDTTVDIEHFKHTSTETTLRLQHAQVTYRSGSDLFVQENGHALDLYATGLNFKEGDIIGGTLRGRYCFRDGLPMLTEPTDNQLNTKGLSTVSPLQIVADSLQGHIGQLVRMHIQEGGITMKDRFALCPTPCTTTLPPGADVTLTGIAALDDSKPVVYLTDSPGFLFADSLHNTYTSWPSADIELHRWVAVSQWNTLTLPFSMTAQQVADVFGEDTQVAAFQGDSCKTLQFVILPSSRIEAGVPYLIHPARDVRVIRLHGVSLSSECHAKSIKGTDYTFIGTLNQEHPAEGSVYLAAANHTKTLVAGGSIKAFRAYFANKSGNAVGLTIESKQPLGILSIHHDTYGKSADFSITGQRVGTSYKGIIVRKGHKFLAR